MLAIVSGVLPNPPLFYHAWPAALKSTWDLCALCWKKSPTDRTDISDLIKNLSSSVPLFFLEPDAKQLREWTDKALALRSKLAAQSLDLSEELSDVSGSLAASGQGLSDMIVGTKVSRWDKEPKAVKVVIKQLRFRLQEHDFDEVRDISSSY